MSEINIARTIISKRKEKGLTQDDLANFIGVSKASVSKWETGQSYPDIVLLPQLAAFFNISLDELVGYEPQMTDADIKKLCSELALEFASKRFVEVMERCREIVKKYYSCFSLLFNMGVLYVNYGYAIASEEQKAATLVEAKELLVRVKEHTDDVQIKQAALNIEATCELMLGNPAQTVDLLENIKSYSPSSFDILLSQAYLMLGKTEKAKSNLQTSVFNGLMNLIAPLMPYLALVTDDTEDFEETCKRTSDIIGTFKIKELVPGAILPFYLQAAHGYLTLGNKDKALDMLEEYAQIAVNKPFEPRKDSYFRYVEGLSETLSDLPRDVGSINKSMVDAVADNDAYGALVENPRYQSIVRRLKGGLLDSV